jgi:phosphatidylglycerol---prolipoprotein diacylglyceryl transferase
MLPILRVFGFTLQTPLLVLMLTYGLAIWVVSRVASRIGLDGGIVSDSGFYGVLIGVAAARVGYVFLNLGPYLQEPLSAFMPSTTALNPAIGICVGAIFGSYFLKRHKVFSVALLDAIAYGIPFLLIGVALASFFSGDAFGTVSQLLWSVYLWGASRHPVQLYECAILFVIIVGMYATRNKKWPDGTRLLIFITLYGLARLFLDGFRADTLTLAGLRVTQLAGMVISATAMWLLGELVSARSPARVGLSAVNDNTAEESSRSPIT